MAQILVPFDHSENAFIALQQALLIAKKSQATVEVFHVINLMATSEYPIAWSEADEQAIKDSLETKVDSAKKSLSMQDEVSVDIVLQRGVKVVDEVLMRASNSNTILIVMGTHGVTGFLDRVLGTNSLDVLTSSKWPVLVIPPHWKAREMNELIVAAELNEFISMTDSVKDLENFFKLPARAIQMTPVIDSIEQKEREVDGIPFEHIESAIDLPLAENLSKYAKGFQESIMVMYTHPRRFFQRLLSISFTEETAKVIETPLLSIKKEIN